LLDFANRSFIHIFALQNPQIESISPKSHRAGVDASSSLNNYNVSLLGECCAHFVVCCTVCRFRSKQFLHSCDVLVGPTDSIRCLARHSLCKRLRRPRANSDVSWLNSAGTRFSKEQEILAHPHHLSKIEQMIMFHHPNTTFPHSSTTM
jgi:hypothetical protein